MPPHPPPGARPPVKTPAEKVAEDALKRKKALEAWGMPEPSTFHRSNHRDANAVEEGKAKTKALHDAQNSKTPGHNPQSAHFSKKFPCTFKGCGRRFDDEKGLKRHKDSEHDYCKVCDEDFDDDEALHLHKMQSEKHVVCNICGVEFNSEPGRDRHAKQVYLPSPMVFDNLACLVTWASCGQHCFYSQHRCQNETMLPIDNASMANLQCANT